ncbi:hypothetical protein CA13_38410 [Planctomycetes bacterium CA13]|uniref:Uncharacterized protein n=1 Tax=Novipirellula herctigrandis TaxID=2527986 RepID=A0A5C5Z4X5_9BACT|nr:hypothetical protein CA13_38410 [Planctomycetes bacterium CA13]
MVGEIPPVKKRDVAVSALLDRGQIHFTKFHCWGMQPPYQTSKQGNGEGGHGGRQTPLCPVNTRLCYQTVLAKIASSRMLQCAANGRKMPKSWALDGACHFDFGKKSPFTGAISFHNFP